MDVVVVATGGDLGGRSLTGYPRTVAPDGGGALAAAPGFRYLRAVYFRREVARALPTASRGRRPAARGWSVETYRTAVWCLFACGLLAVGFGAGCNRRAKNPAEAWRRTVAAIKQRDARSLYGALDLETRWSWMTIRRSQREAHDIVLSNFPEGTARDQQLRRFEAAAAAESEADLFAAWFPAERWDGWPRDLPEAAAPIESAADRAEIQAAGQTWPFRKGQDGGWGYAGLSQDAEQVKRRALADLELARNNAADLERAATRAGK